MSNSVKPHVHIAIPAMEEYYYIPETINCIEKQTYQNLSTQICVNQPDNWWNTTNKIHVCLNNQQTLEYLKSINLSNSSLNIIDKSSRGNGWKSKKSGVGHARKLLMDNIISHASDDDDIILSMDADTKFNPGYINSVAEIFKNNPKAVALANPYYHHLTGDESIDRPMLRYEVYMRSYNINLLRIGSPYSFTAFGSVISMPVWAYKKIRGITPKESGEDFYLLQKLRKMGHIILYNYEVVYPASRISDRVPYGTGPAISKSLTEQQASYPVFKPEFFDEVKETYNLFEDLFYKDIKTPMSDFFKHIFKTDDIFSPLRKNYKTSEKFVNACHNKIDGLRVFQFLKWRSANEEAEDEKSLLKLMKVLNLNDWGKEEARFEKLNFHSYPVSEINNIRDYLFKIENEMRAKYI